jgi:type II secretory pathway pseudopilin PulG
VPVRIDRDEGVTLLELLVIVVVTCVVSTVVAVALRGGAARGAEAACTADARILAGAVEAFVATHSSDPLPDQQALVTAGLLRQASRRFDVLDGVVVLAKGSSCSSSPGGGALPPATSEPSKTVSVAPLSTVVTFSRASVG